MINNRGVISYLKFKPVNSSLRISLGIENYKLVDQNERNITLYGANSFILVYLGNLESYNGLPGCCKYDHAMDMNQTEEKKETQTH